MTGQVSQLKASFVVTILKVTGSAWLVKGSERIVKLSAKTHKISLST
jgi:hypothetical protein